MTLKKRKRIIVSFCFVNENAMQNTLQSFSIRMRPNLQPKYNNNRMATLQINPCALEEMSAYSFSCSFILCSHPTMETTAIMINSLLSFHFRLLPWFQGRFFFVSYCCWMCLKWMWMWIKITAFVNTTLPIQIVRLNMITKLTFESFLFLLLLWNEEHSKAACK